MASYLGPKEPSFVRSTHNFIKNTPKLGGFYRVQAIPTDQPRQTEDKSVKVVSEVEDIVVPPHVHKTSQVPT